MPAKMGNAMKSLCRLIAIFAFGLWAMNSAAQAQVGNDDNDADDCLATVVGDEGEFDITYDVCGTAYTTRYSTIRLTGILQRVIGQSFGFGPARVEPAGLSGLLSGDTRDRLQQSAIVITPTSGDADQAAAPVRPINVWADGRVLYTDYIESAGDLDGPTTSILAGFDYKLNSKLTAGLLLSIENSQLESALNNLDSRSIGVGPYVGMVLTDNIVASASLIGTRISSNQAGGLLDYDTSRVQAAAALSGYWYKDTWRFNPGVSLSWSKDWEEENNGFTADRTVAVTLLTSSLQIGNTLQLSDTVTMEPWAGYAFDWTLDNTTHTEGFGTFSYSNIDARLLAGLNFGLPGNAQLSITGEAGGLLLNELDSFSVDANLAVQF